MKRNQVVSFLVKYYQFFMLLLIIGFLAVTTPSFLNLTNIGNIIMQQIPMLLIISIGMTLSILTKGIDLSIGSNLALTSCVAASLIVKGQDFLGIVAGLALGTLIGALNGILITKVHLAPFIATYSMDLVTRGLAQLFMGGALIYGFSDRFCRIATGDVGPLSNLMVIAFLLFAVLFFLLNNTTFGRNVYAIGNNEQATCLSGIQTDWVLISVYAINGFLAAVAGLLYISRLNAAEASIGADFTMKMMAATLIGGTPFCGGKGGIGRTLVGVCIMMFITNGMNLNAISSNWQDAVFGAVIVISLFIGLIGDKITKSNK